MPKNTHVTPDSEKLPPTNIRYIQYTSEKESAYLPSIRQLISKDLSEPYSIYVYRYFLYEWPDLCFIVGHIMSSFITSSPSYHRITAQKCRKRTEMYDVFIKGTG